MFPRGQNFFYLRTIALGGSFRKKDFCDKGTIMDRGAWWATVHGVAKELVATYGLTTIT